MSDKDLKDLEKTLRVLGNMRRLKILKFLKSGPKSVGAIAKNINLSIKATSKHLSIMYPAGIVDREQVSLLVLYSISKDLSRLSKHIISIL